MARGAQLAKSGSALGLGSEAACEDSARGSVPASALGPASRSGRGLQPRLWKLPGPENNDHLSLCEYFKAELVKRSRSLSMYSKKADNGVWNDLSHTKTWTVHSFFYHHWISPAAFSYFLNLHFPTQGQVFRSQGQGQVRLIPFFRDNIFGKKLGIVKQRRQNVIFNGSKVLF